MNTKNTKNTSSLKDFIVFSKAHLKGEKRNLIILFLIVSAYVFCGRLVPYLFGLAVDMGIKAQNLSVLYQIAMGFALVNILRPIFGFFMNYSLFKLGEKLMLSVRKELMTHVQSLPISFFERQPSGKIVTRLSNDTKSLKDLFSQGLVGVGVNVFELISIVFTLIFISWILTAGVLLSLPLVLFLALKLNAKIKAQYLVIKAQLSEINAFSAENLNGVQSLQLYNATDDVKTRLITESASYKKSQLYGIHLFASLWPMIEFYQVFCILLALGGGVFLVDVGQISVGSLSAFLLLLQGFFHPVRNILERFNQFQNGLASLQRVKNFFNETPESESQAASRKLEASQVPSALIELKDVSYQYTPDGVKALNNVSCSIQKKQKIAIVGRTGSGKTTLISLLQKFYTPTEGDILLQGKSLRNLRTIDVRKKIKVLRQEEFIFKGSLKANLSFNNPEYSDKEIVEIINKIGLQHKRNLFIEEAGENLSAGEKQLIAIGRMMLAQPEILILDEATSHVDQKTESQIKESLMALIQDKTCFIIAHRLDTILSLDEVWIMAEGKIIEQGAPHALLTQPESHFYKLYHDKL